MKSNQKKIINYILTLFIFFLIAPNVSAGLFEKDVFDNVNINLSGPSQSRSWNATFVTVKISNFNDNVPVIVEDISILNSKNELIHFEDTNFISYPVGKEKKVVDWVMWMRNKISMYNPLIVPFMMLSAPILKEANLKIKENQFYKIFRDLSVNSFYPKLNEEIIINIQVTLHYGDEIIVRRAHHSTIMRQPFRAINVINGTIAFE